MIEFYIQADKNFDGSPRCREYYRFFSAEQMITGGGAVQPRVDTFGLVDDDIRAQNPKQYAIFKTYLDAHDTEIYNEARSKPGIPVLVPPVVEEVVAAPVVEEVVDFEENT